MVDRNFLNDIEEKQAIDEIVEKGFVGRKASRMHQRYLVAAVAVIMIGIPAFGFAFPAIAANIPIIGGIFDRDDLHGQERLIGFSEYATIIGETQVSEDVSVTLSEAIFDGERVYLTYLVESDRDISDVFMFEMPDVGLIIDGARNRMMNTAVDYHNIDDYSFLFIVMLAPHSSDVAGAETIEVFLSLSTLLGLDLEILEATGEEVEHVIAEGPWNFQIPLESIGNESVIVDQTVSYEDIEATVVSLTASPVGIRMQFSYRAPFLGAYIEDEDLILGAESIETILEWVVTDDLGNILDRTEGNEHSGEGWMRGHQSFASPDRSATEIIITPVVYVQLLTVTHADSEMIIRSIDVLERTELEPIIIELP